VFFLGNEGEEGSEKKGKGMGEEKKKEKSWGNYVRRGSVEEGEEKLRTGGVREGTKFNTDDCGLEQRRKLSRVASRIEVNQTYILLVILTHRTMRRQSQH
jgi:hypothetical protein